MRCVLIGVVIAFLFLLRKFDFAEFSEVFVRFGNGFLLGALLLVCGDFLLLLRFGIRFLLRLSTQSSA